MSRAAHADDDPLGARRARVERAEEEVRLRERELTVEERQRALRDRPRATPYAAPRAFSRKGRVVFPELAGIASRALLGTPPNVGGFGVSGLLSYGVASSELTGGGRSTTSTLSFRPSADVFVTDRWTLGLMAEVSRFTSEMSYGGGGNGTLVSEQSGYSLSAMPRIGRAFDLGPVTFWPKLGVGYAVMRSEQDANPIEPANRTLSRTISGHLALDLVFPLSDHVLFDLGPFFAVRHSEGTTNRSIAMSIEGESVVLGVQAHLGVTLP